MGIKDNFSQAVKELWKKDGQSKDSDNKAEGSTELDKYLRQEAASQPTNTDGNVPLETPYYRDPAAAQNTAPTSNNTDGINQNTQSSPEPQEQAFAQNIPNNPNTQNTGGQTPQADSGSNGINQNVQNIRGNFGQNNDNVQSSGNVGYDSSGNVTYNRNGYNQNGYGNDGYGNGGYGGGYVPPTDGGAPAQMQAPNETDELTVISKNTVIDGNIHSLANMRIDGNIKGNVETTRNVDMSGKIVGDITCNNAGMNSAAMQGNVSLKGRMRMDRDTILIGDLSSQYADINGRIRGKLDIVGKAELKRDAIVFGDINASTIAVTDGAIIQGYVNTTFLSKEDSRNVFPEAISFDSKEANAQKP